MTRRRYFAGLAALVLSAAGLGAAVAPAAPASAATGCSVAYTVTNQWNTGFGVSITVTNLGSPVTSWTLGYSYAGNQQLTQGWSGNWSQSGPAVTVTNASWNGSLGTGASVQIGANFSYSGTNTAPATFTLNGVTCTGQVGGGGGTINVNPTSLSVAQGSTGKVGVSLSAAPSANVSVTVAGTGNTGLAAAPTSLTFSPSNFATAQNVTITANSSGTGTTTFTLSATGYTSVTVTATETSSGGGGGGPAAQLHVSGNKLLTASGQQVILRGIDRSGTEYACVQGSGIFDGEVDQAAITAMKSWGINAVRVPLNEACWNGESYVNPAYAGANYQNAIKSWVSLLISNGLDVILDLHWTDGAYTGPSAGCSSAQAICQKPMPDAAQAIPFWSSVAKVFGGNDAVIFDLFNEPYASRADNNNSAEGWQCWATGSPCTGISYPVAGMQQMINAVRGAGANNVIMLGGEEYSNDLTGWLQYRPTDPANNLAASWHSYNFNACSSQSCWTSQIAPVIASVPVIASEIGENDCSGSYINPLTSWLDSQNTSYLAWAWNADFNCSSGPGLVTDYVPGTPTNYGAAYKAHLASLGL
ncbi:MAG: cellulase family glycosylhydrolase [Actinomycetota bacterium]|nr:cellulase family glycosylhydrolase [Actinomycetota bacterium]